MRVERFEGRTYLLNISLSHEYQFVGIGKKFLFDNKVHVAAMVIILLLVWCVRETWCIYRPSSDIVVLLLGDFLVYF